MRRTLVLTAALLALACTGEPARPPSSARPDFAVSREFSGGPVALVVRLTSETVSLAETVVLEEEVVADPGFVAELPEFEPSEFEGLGVTDISEDPPELRAGKTVARRRLTLEPERSGTVAIPPREAWFHREGEERESSVSSEALVIEVAPIEDAAGVALPAPRPALTREQVGEAGASSAWWAALLVPLAGVAAFLLLRRRTRKEPPPRPAHEFAWEALRRLVALGLVEKGEAERFLVILTEILREYIERRFGVRAPERTTDEFLVEAGGHESLRSHREDLEAFLRLADRVKFARLEPEEKDVQGSFDLSKEFIEATMESAGGSD